MGNICYAVKNKDEVCRMNSQSGGAFTALSNVVLHRNGVVYGCVLEEKQVFHIRATNEKLRDKMHGSKYVQSDLRDTFRMVQKDLLDDCIVMFSGTPCQVDGLKSFLKEDYSNLFCVDILCHGVPSPMVWEKYLEWLENKEKSSISSFIFRNKMKVGWRRSIETIFFDNGNERDERIFAEIFYGNNALRPTCYQCRYKTIERVGDITLADFWGIENIITNIDDDKGVSMVVVNSDKGKSLFDAAKNEIYVIETKLCKTFQPALGGEMIYVKQRNEFWNDLHKYKFAYIARKYGGNTIFKRIKRKIKKKLNK